LDWTTSFLVGAVLAPTDPVFASAIVGRREVPARLRQLLNVESGVNDGLALPVVLLLIAAAGPMSGAAEQSLSTIALELVGGLAVGITLPLVVAWLVRFRLLGAEPKLQPLLPLAVGVILYATCHLTHANPYLAAFSAGAVLASVSPECRHAFEPLGEALAELSKFAALLVFGALLTPRLFGDLSLGGYAAVVLAIVLIRPASLLISLVGTRISRRERLTAALVRTEGVRLGRLRPVGARVRDSAGPPGLHADRGLHRLLHRGAQQHGRAHRPDVRRRGPRRHPRRRDRDADTRRESRCRSQRRAPSREHPHRRSAAAAGRGPQRGGGQCERVIWPSRTRR